MVEKLIDINGPDNLLIQVVLLQRCPDDNVTLELFLDKKDVRRKKKLYEQLNE